MSAAELASRRTRARVRRRRAIPSSSTTRRITSQSSPPTAATPRILTRSLDRNVHVAACGRATGARSISCSKTIAISTSRASTRRNGKVERLVDGRRETTAFDVGGKDRIAVLDGIVEAPDAVYALDERRYRRADASQRRLARQREARRHGRDLVRLQGRHAHQRLRRQAARLRGRAVAIRRCCGSTAARSRSTRTRSR